MIGCRVLRERGQGGSYSDKREPSDHDERSLVYSMQQLTRRGADIQGPEPHMPVTLRAILLRIVVRFLQATIA